MPTDISVTSSALFKSQSYKTNPVSITLPDVETELLARILKIAFNQQNKKSALSVLSTYKAMNDPGDPYALNALVTASILGVFASL